MGTNIVYILTLEAKFSTSEIMEFLKSVAAVRGRLVTSVMLNLPSGHMAFRTGFELQHKPEWLNESKAVILSMNKPAGYWRYWPVVQQPLEVLK